MQQVIALLHSHFEEEKVQEVMEYMKLHGAPTIHGYETGVDDIWQAIEGTHRLIACERLGVTPNLVDLDEDTLVADLSDVDLLDDGAYETVGEVGDWENKKVLLDVNWV